MAAALIVAYIIITWVFGCVGIAITLNRGCPVFCVAIFGTFMFLFVSIPLMAEGSALRVLKNLDDSDLDKMCKMSPDEARDEYGRGMVGSFLQFAHRFDTMSESILNEYMCTEVCPCLDYDSMGQGSKNIYITNPNIDLSSYNRTSSKSDRSRTYLNFTSDN